MKLLGLGFSIVLTILTFPVYAESTGQTMKHFGLVGTWSFDCAIDLNKGTGIRITFDVPPLFGEPTETLTSSFPEFKIVTTMKSGIKSAIMVTDAKLKIAVVILETIIIENGHINNTPKNLESGEHIFEKSGSKMNMFIKDGQYSSPLEKCLN